MLLGRLKGGYYGGFYVLVLIIYGLGSLRLGVDNV